MLFSFSSTLSSGCARTLMLRFDRYKWRFLICIILSCFTLASRQFTISNFLFFTNFPFQYQKQHQQGFGNSFGRWPRQTRDWSPSDALRPSKRLSRRGTFLKAAMCASLSSVAFLHEAGYVHRSLSPSSFLLSQVNDDDDAAAFSLLGRLASRTISNSIRNNVNGGDSRSNTGEDAPIDDGVMRSLNQGGGLRVKLTDFGFAATLMDAASDPILRKRCGPNASPFDRTARATAEDLEALGFVWLELVFSSLALSREAPPGRGVVRMLLQISVTYRLCLASTHEKLACSLN